MSIRPDYLEETVLDGLKSRLMKPELVREFIAEYHREINRLSGQLDVEQRRVEKELHQVDLDIHAIVESIKAGFRTDAMREELERLEARKNDLKSDLSTRKPSPIRLHPNLAAVYRGKVDQLRDALNQEEARVEAATILRGLVEEIRLIPENGKLRVHLVGQLAQLLALGQKHLQPGLKETGLQVTLVAGTRINLYRTKAH